MEATADARRRRAIAERLLTALDGVSTPRATMLTGSVGEGTADAYSDLDLLAYYDELPDLPALRRWQAEVGDAPTDGMLSEPGWGATFGADGVECQFAAFLVGPVEARVGRLLAGEDPDSAELQKTAEGLLRGLVIRDDGLVEGWRRRLAAFPDALANGAAAHHLRIFPYWTFQPQLARRDAELFETQELLDGAFHVLGALSAANRCYFTSLQLKRMRDHIGHFRVAPERLAERLEGLLTLDHATAAGELRALVEETVVIVERLLPAVDTAAIRKALH